MDCIWDASQYHPKLWANIFEFQVVIQGHESRKVQTENLMFERGDTCLRSVFIMSVKNDPRILLNGPNRTEFGNRDIAEIPGNSVKIPVFDLQKNKTCSFFKIYLLAVLYTCTLNRVISIYLI